MKTGKPRAKKVRGNAKVSKDLYWIFMLESRKLIFACDPIAACDSSFQKLAVEHVISYDVRLK